MNTQATIARIEIHQNRYQTDVDITNSSVADYTNSINIYPNPKDNQTTLKKNCKQLLYN